MNLSSFINALNEPSNIFIFYSVTKACKNSVKFFKNAFETQKQTQFHETQLQKHANIASQRLRFKLMF
jgi:hypothetical protein